CPLTDFGGKTSIFSHPVYLFLRKFSLQDSRGGSPWLICAGHGAMGQWQCVMVALTGFEPATKRL
ncbi:hypothetical protein, partial [Escherichia coli]|uniref:hypothetical protein n=1 Tax=Escherichia coli TaxID=562 RepID=UPI0019814D70